VSELLDDAIEAAGGRSRWGEVNGISARIRSGGLLMRMKGRARSFRDYGVSIETGAERATIEPYPKEGTNGVFDAGKARIERPDGSIVAERRDARRAFFGLSGLRRDLRWDELDALYFAGYALWNYLMIPFLFDSPGFEVSEGEGPTMDGEELRRLDVTFPPELHTHCRQQVFYFDSLGLLRRHDYHPDVVSSLAKAAHFCDAHREVGGLVLATKRRVVPKGTRGRPLRGPTVVSLEFDSIEVE
jgi:hypothetical protein